MLLLICLLSLIHTFGIDCPLIKNESSISIDLAASSSTGMFGSHAKIAIFGDTGYGNNSVKVLNMVKSWGADLIVVPGDFDYRDSPVLWMNQFHGLFSKKQPLLATPGNHDILKWFEPAVGYKELLMKQAKSSGILKYCQGEYGINQYCYLDNMVFILSGIGTLGTNHVQFIDEIFTRFKNVPWKFCIWHKNQQKLQTGDKTDETGYLVYEMCRKYGAMVFTGHEHSYERTHLMSNYETQKVASNSSFLELRPGYSFAAVSGLGGDSIRSWKFGNQNLPHWAATAAADNGVNYGALLCKFGIKGHSHKGSCEFRDIDGKKWDEFTLSTNPFPAIQSNSLSHPIFFTKEFPCKTIKSLGRNRTYSNLDILNFNSMEHYLEFKIDPLPNKRISQAVLQFMLVSEYEPGPFVQIEFELIENSRLMKQASAYMKNSIIATIDSLDAGHVWNSPNLVRLMKNEVEVLISIKSDMQLNGKFGFRGMDSKLGTCVSPTLMVTYT